ncbi:EAL domain-containing protein [Shewanella submarina]|uniref:Bifunctional diguanylate cyclase/phosphodiesterase n=1 Tax=Shewanella submarina TaxID=2016376 RepID=A0ABV7GDQ8_9GAMM|nr:EAL domain-containing protein [Shewanella submarina]MCL1036991.1 EAL domain-containing protein [Shewanella submarina]
MKLLKRINGRTAIIVAGGLLTAYLALILTVTNLGQSKLEESQRQSLSLKIRNYTDNLSFFFDVSQQNLANLASNQATTTYFANLAAGMSVKYGLGSSLFNLEQTIGGYMHSSKIDNLPIYKRVRVIGLGGTSIIDTGDGLMPPGPAVPLKEMEHHRQKIEISKTESGLSINLLHTIYHQNKPVAVLVAEVNNDVLIYQLSIQEHKSSKSCLSLLTPLGGIKVWNTLTPDTPVLVSPPQAISANTQLIYLEKLVKGTPFKLISWYEPVNNQDIFTSTWFIAAISLLAVPVLAGLVFLMRVYNANLVLQTEIAVAAEQQKSLAEKNVLLSQEVDKRRASEMELAFRAAHDDLTGLANRQAGMAALQRAIDKANVSGNSVLVMFLDLDNFKQVNDTVGHHAGDRLLIQTSERLQRAIRHTDTLARFGGDEFMLIIPELSGQDAARVLAHGILSLFEEPFNHDGQEFFVSTSIGMAMYPQDGDTPANLLKKSDAALYRAKETGRNGYSFYDANMNQDLQRKLALNVRLHQAITNDELDVHYQPIVDLKTGQIVAAEALMRWTDRELGFISPAEFIPLAEKNGLIHRLGDIVLQQACRQAAQWQALAPLAIAINFSSVQFRQCEQLQQRVLQVLAEVGLPPDRLEMEVTESIFIEQDTCLINTLNHLKSVGVQLSIDDFGTGYSALSYLQRFSFSKLKIDRSFIQGMTNNVADRSLVNAMLAMAKSLDLKVVAEGIEEQPQADYLNLLGCEYGQGYLFSRPLSAAEFTQLLQSQTLQIA